ncbi:GIDE domain-containing protein [Amycolatopsis sp. NPDC006125]|uniref:GIDE domain-containing protein n=1 Tax=Amycolatopsis sp. NPDC006125 TaxID=3156730 RepID=UPI0033BD5A06
MTWGRRVAGRHRVDRRGGVPVPPRAQGGRADPGHDRYAHPHGRATGADAADGPAASTRGRETVAEGQAPSSFVLVDPQRRPIELVADGARPEAVEKPVDSYQTDFRAETVEFLGLQWPRGRGTLGFHYEEWIVRPGTWLYVLGEARDVTGSLVIGKPEDGSDFIIAAKPEGELRAGRGRRHRVLGAAACALVLVGLALIVTEFWIMA